MCQPYLREDTTTKREKTRPPPPTPTPKQRALPNIRNLPTNSTCDSDSDFDMEYDSSEPIEVIITKPIPSDEYAIMINELQNVHTEGNNEVMLLRGKIKNLEEENRNLRQCHV